MTTHLNGLMAQEAGETQQVALWAHAHVDLGASVARYEPAQDPLVVAAALPTRAFAAVFAAAGFVLQRATGLIEHLDPNAHFQHLCHILKERGPQIITYKEAQNRQVSGTLVGVHEEPTGPHLELRIHGNETKYIPPFSSPRVQVSSRARATGHRSKIVGAEYGFLAAALGGADAATFVRTTRLDCVLIGVRAYLQPEIIGAEFSLVGPSGARERGHLQDILRIRGLPQATDHYRTVLLSDAQGDHSGRLTPALVIFDGAAAFLDCRHAWRGAPWLVLLDRTDRRFDEARAEVNRAHMYRRGEAPGLTIGALPPGVEAMVFEAGK